MFSSGIWWPCTFHGPSCLLSMMWETARLGTVNLKTAALPDCSRRSMSGVLWYGLTVKDLSMAGRARNPEDSVQVSPGAVTVQQYVVPPNGCCSEQYLIHQSFCQSS